MYNLKLLDRQARRVRRAKVTYDAEDVSSDDEWITEKEEPVLPPQKNWLRALDRIAHRESEKEQEVDPEQEVENMVNNLTEACTWSYFRILSYYFLLYIINNYYFSFLLGGDDLGLDQDLDGYDLEDYNPDDGDDDNN
jgi:hypothetical protein